MHTPNNVKNKHSRFSEEFTTDRWGRFLQWVCLGCAVVLVLVWPLPGTIAARNIALVLGCLTSVAWLYHAKLSLDIKSLLPVLCLLAVPIWLWIHYLALPTNTVAQLYELKGTWVRVTLGILMASGLGLMIKSRPSLISWLLVSMTAYAIISLVNFLIEAWALQQWLILNYHYPFKGKFALVNFLIYPCLFAYASLHMALLQNDYVEKKTNDSTITRFLIFILIICWVNFINAQALNGIIIATLAGFFLVFILLKSSFSNWKDITTQKYLLFFNLIFLIVICLVTFWKIDQKSNQKFSNLIENIQISMQITKHFDWQEDSRNEKNTRPSNSDGETIPHSVYSRVAWFIKGIDVLQENPLGSGFSHLAFRHYIIQENPYSQVIMTHSGWLDFALGTGLPGLILTWMAIFLVIKRAYFLITDKMTSFPLIGYLALWTLSGLWLVWWLSELSEREYIEQLFFMTALFATAIPRPKHINSNFHL